MRWEGFAYAAAAAIAHSCIDASRKLASQRFTSAELVGLVGVLDAAFLSLLVYGTGTTFYAGTHTFVHRAQLHLFLAIVVCGACVKVLVGFMYQRALHVSPLSVTVPYLAFTPVLLLFTGYIVVHESPSSQGLLGVFVVTLGGYLLAIDQTHGGEAVVEWKQKMKGSSLLKPSGNLPNSTSESLLISAIPALAAVLNFKAGSEKKTSSWPAAASIVPDQDVNDDDDDVAADEKQEQTLQAGAGHDDENSVKISLPLTLKGRNWKWREWLGLGYVLNPLLALMKEEGSVLMLGVAGLLSFSNSLDKLGMHIAPSIVVFAAFQRILMAIPVVIYLAFTSPSSFAHLYSHFPTMVTISICECVAIICYLKSLETLLVSYAIAAKRSNVLLSVLVGHVIFKERICKRLPYVFLMVGGMVLIVFA
ncbi:unnamed protein product [Sphagnum troendelagicum]|uniref:EamA domain-containing protein n=1 Tax=Sphagnum troendelagicum TaxID=128251 RepID=A0ABP0TEV0_9BRYO